MFINNSYSFLTFPEIRHLNTNIGNPYYSMLHKMIESTDQSLSVNHQNFLPPTPNLLDQSLAYPYIWISFQNLCKEYVNGLSSKTTDFTISSPDLLPLNLSSSTMSPVSSRNSCHSIKSNCSVTSAKTKTFSCPVCEKRYCTESGMKRHQSRQCTLIKIDSGPIITEIPTTVRGESRQYSCRQCNKVYFSLSALKMHVRTHTLPCKCNVCGKAFSRMWLLTGHMRTHTGEKPFSCNECDRAFADRSNLRAHMQTHSQTKRYQCDVCQKTFSRMGLLTKHRLCCPSI